MSETYRHLIDLNEINIWKYLFVKGLMLTIFSVQKQKAPFYKNLNIFETVQWFCSKLSTIIKRKNATGRRSFVNITKVCLNSATFGFNALFPTKSAFATSVQVQGGPKNVALYFRPSSPITLIDFQNSFPGTLCGQFAITWLLHIPPHCKCVSTLSCEISMKYAYITIITNKHFGKIIKNTSDQHYTEWFVWHLTVWVQYSLVATDHLSQCWSEMFFSSIQISVIIVSFCLHLYFTR